MWDQNKLYIFKLCGCLSVFAEIEIVTDAAVEHYGKLFVEDQQEADCAVFLQGEKLFEQKLHLIINYNCIWAPLAHNISINYKYSVKGS